MPENKGILIIGADLSGLTLAHLLFKRDIQAIIQAAAPRLDGKIYTQIGASGIPLELGAT